MLSQAHHKRGCNQHVCKIDAYYSIRFQSSDGTGYSQRMLPPLLLSNEESGIRKGCPSIASDHMKLDELLRMSGLLCESAFTSSTFFHYSSCLPES